MDTTTTNPEIPALDGVDPMLAPPGLPVCARAWTGEPYDRFSEPVSLDSKLWDWHLSPMYGDLSVMRNVTIFISEGGNHVYPYYPTPEGREAFKTICGMI